MRYPLELSTAGGPRCAYRKICGGSRARAYAYGGDYLAAAPACIYEPPARGEQHAPHE
ncbi:MAG: hypothetical protein HYZ81_18690 [Nitrospinae bacterium]|nr:hypothetical protein [Nitrospinota bacterium]